MTSRRFARPRIAPQSIAPLLVAAVLAVPPAQAFAQTFAQAAAEPAPKRAAPPRKAHPKAPARPAARAAAAPAARSPILGSGGGADEAASMERRRRAFFADKPDAGGAEQTGRPSAGVTLGGSGGITPGMGFSF